MSVISLNLNGQALMRAFGRGDAPRIAAIAETAGSFTGGATVRLCGGARRQV